MTPYLDVQHLSKSFGALQLFEDISFSIGEGQKVGLIAKNGTGKSTLLSILCGREGYDAGDIVFRRDLKIGFLEQSPTFDPEETVLDACFNHQGDPEKVLKAKQVLTQLKIKDLEQPMGQLSGGQQKRVALANVLLTEPDLLILDEPTVGLDPKQIIEIRTLIKKLGRNHTVILSSHILSEVQAVCDKIVVINEGRIVADDTEDNLSQRLSQDNRLTVRIEGEQRKVTEMLEGIKNVVKVDIGAKHGEDIMEYRIEAKEGSDIRRELFTSCVEHGFVILEMKSSELTLEDIFLRLTMGESITGGEE